MNPKPLLIALALACAACVNEAPAPYTRGGSAPAATAQSASAAQVSPGDPKARSARATDETATPTIPDAPRAVPATPQTAATPTAAPEARRVTPDELREAMDRGEAILVDVRGESEWSFRRAKEAIHVPHDQLFTRSAELPHEPLIALYCT